MKKETIKTLDDHIIREFDTYNDVCVENLGLVENRSIVRLFLLAQSISSENIKVKDIIYNLATALNPIIQRSGYVVKPKTIRLLDYNNNIYACNYNEKKYKDQLVFSCAPIEFLLESYTKDDISMYHLGKFYGELKSEANKVFEDTVWYNFKRTKHWKFQ